MTKMTIDATIAKLEAERDRVRARRRRREQEDAKDRSRLSKIDYEIHRAKLTALLGVPSGVKIRTRFHSSHRCHRLNNVTGTLIKIARTRAEVVFDSGQDNDRWTWPIDDMIPATSDQGWYLAALAEEARV